DSPEAMAEEAARWRSLLERAQQIPEAPLSEEDRVTRAMLARSLEDSLSARECHFEEWTVDHVGGDLVEVLNLPSTQRSGTPEDRRNVLSRLRKLPAYLDQHVKNLRRGLAAGRVGTADAVGRMLGELDKLLGQKASD